MAWTRAAVDLLAVMYPDPEVTKVQIQAALLGHKWGDIRKRAHKISVQRPRVVAAEAAHPLLKTFAGILRQQGISAVAVLQESGRGRDLASEWLRGRRDPRLSHFDAALREAGFHLAILPLDPSEPARASPVRYFAPAATTAQPKTIQSTSAALPQGFPASA